MCNKCPSDARTKNRVECVTKRVRGNNKGVEEESEGYGLMSPRSIV